MRHSIAIAILGTAIGCSADRAISPAPQPRAEVVRWCSSLCGQVQRVPCGPPPLMFVNGRRRDSVDDIVASQILSLEVVKGAEAVRLYGEEARRGAILITLKER